MTLDEVGKRFGVSTSRVRSWIRSGQLAAVDVSRKLGSKKPRYTVTPDALAEFERARSTRTAAPGKKRRGMQTPQYV